MDMEERYIAAVDLGSSQTRLTVARINGDDIQIQYYGETASDGIRNSAVFNPKKAAEPLKKVISEAENELNIKILQVVVGLPRCDVRQENNSASILIHVVYHVLHKGKVSFALRRKFAVFVETLVLHEVHIGRPVCRIRRIGNLNTELHVPEVVMLQGITVIDVKVAIRDSAQNHVHSGEVISRGGQFLSVIVSHVGIVLEA